MKATFNVVSATMFLLIPLFLAACQINSGTIMVELEPTDFPLTASPDGLGGEGNIVSPEPISTSTAKIETTPPSSLTSQVDSPQVSKLFGLFNFHPSEAANWPFTLTRLGYRVDHLQLARQTELKVLVALTGGHGSYTGAEGCFDLDMWKARIDRVDQQVIKQFIDDGTIIGLYAIDEPHHFNNGANQDCPSVPFSDINAACHYANSKWPNLPCGVGTSPAWLAQGFVETDYEALGFLFTQWSLRHGDITQWINQQELDAEAFGLPLYLSIQAILHNPTPEQLEEAGIAICHSSAVGVMMWKWDGEVFSRPGMLEAMNRIAAACAE